MILVVDLEATCWHNDIEQGNKPNEIIEIGIVQLNSNYDFVKSHSYVVKPRLSEVSKFCTELTGWTQDAINQGKDIVEVLKQVDEEFQVTKATEWWSYGSYDRNKLSGDKSRRGSLGLIYGISSPFDKVSHFNAKEELAHIECIKPIGMAKALKYLGMVLEGRHHNGEDDAKNIAKIVKRIAMY